MRLRRILVRSTRVRFMSANQILHRGASGVNRFHQNADICSLVLALSIIHESVTRPSWITTFISHKLNDINPRGGQTVVFITNLEEGKTYNGQALCSLSDTFDRKFGIKIAINRALKGVNI